MGEQDENDIDAEEEANGNDVDDVQEFEKEMNLALDNVRRLAAINQEELVNKISASYVEYNGVGPTVNDLSAIFGRIKQKFADEAADDFLEFCVDANDADDIEQGRRDQAEDLF